MRLGTVTVAPVTVRQHSPTFCSSGRFRDWIMRVLVIDDSRPVRGILAKMLRELDFDVTEAANGREAIERLREIDVPQLVTVNWNMPIMDGLEFIRAVRSDSRFDRLPLMVVSAESEQATVDRAMEAGATEFLVKPVTKQMMKEKLTSLGITPPQPRPSADPPQPDRQSPARTAPTPCTAAPTPRTLAGRAPAASRSAPIRVLIVDDSVVVRGVISSLIEEDREVEVAGTAANGKIGLEKISRLNPDVVLLDIEMPIMNGLEMLRELRKRDPRLPVIMFSSLTERGTAATLDALLLGANDYVPKPGGTSMRDAEAGKQAIRQELIPKLKQFAVAHDKRLVPRAAAVVPGSTHRPAIGQRVDVVAIGVSTGGPQALAELLPAFVPDCPVPILVVQHMPPPFTRHLAARLSEKLKLHVCEGEDGRELQQGHVYVAPGGFHMQIERNRGRSRIRLNKDPPENACRPSVDVLLRSVAETYGAASLTVVLTGMGNDGLRGCRALYELGGRIIVQDEQSSVVWGMPGHVAREGLADGILPLDDIGPEISRRVWEKRSRAGTS
jgi:two-component system chemotaxis response regulator CheB